MAKFGVVVFGSSIFDFQSHLNNPRFKKSAEEFQRVIADKKVLPDCEIDALDLYDKALSTGDTIDEILKFTSGDHDDYILYYCGHGTVGIRESDYKVLLRRSDRERGHTLLNPNELLRDVKKKARRKRVYLILDSCYSGAAVGETMRAGDEAVLIERGLKQVVRDGGRGTAVFTSAGRLGVAIAKEEDEVTLFTGAFVRCLRDGLAEKSNMLRFSWQDLRDEIVRVTSERLGDNAPIPQLISYSETASDITRVDFFCNQAFVAATPPPPSPPQPDPPPDPTIRELRYWESLYVWSPAHAYDDFLAKFPTGTFAVPARIRLYEKINGFAEPELEQYIQDYPNSVVMDQVDRRLAELKWNGIRNSTNIAELERFAQRFPKSKLKREAEQKIAEIRAAQASPEVSVTYSLLDTGKPPLTEEAKPSPTKEETSSPSPFRLSRIALLAGGLGVIWLIASLSRSPIVPTPVPTLTPVSTPTAVTKIEPPRSAPTPITTPTSVATITPPLDRNVGTPAPVTFDTFVNFDISQHDIGMFYNTSYSSCNDKCRSDGRCVAFIFDKWKNACYLKDQVGPLVLDPRYTAVIRSDQPRPWRSTDKTDTCLYHNSSMVGEIGRSLNVPSAASCKLACEGNEECVAYTFVKSERRCNIFNSVSNRIKDDSNGESGARMQNSC
jgi:PAN domain